MRAHQSTLEIAPEIAAPNSGTSLVTEAHAPIIRENMEQEGVVRKPRQLPKRFHLIYPEIPTEAALQARELLGLVAASDPSASGAWVPVRDLARFYREYRKDQGLPRLPWVAIARHLKHIAPMRLWKRNGQRRVCYKIPSIRPVKRRR